MRVRRGGVIGAAAVVAAVGAGVAVAASPVSGSIAGPVTSAGGSVFTVKTSLSPTGSSKVSVGSKTVITEQVTASRSDLKKGTCVMATGQRSSKGVVAASRISITQGVNGTCGGGFGGQGGRPRQAPPSGSSNQRPPAGGNFGNFGFAFGAITAIKGSTLTVKSAIGTTSVTVSSKTTITRMQRAGVSAIKVKLCAFVFGTSSDKGKTVAAQSVNVSQPNANGCTARFRGP